MNKSIQLYMVPGMGHCQGGPGTDTFNKMAAIEQWMGRSNTMKPVEYNNKNYALLIWTVRLAGHAADAGGLSIGMFQSAGISA